MNFSVSITEEIISLFATGNGAYTANIPIDGCTLTQGSQLHLILQNTNSINPTLNLFGTAIPIRYSDSTIIRAGVLIGGTSIRIIFDGSIFRMIQSFPEPCPAGFLSVNNKYCIEKNERQSENFFAAVTACNGENAELCNWVEWYFACLNSSSLTLTGMVNNYEWLDDAANASLKVKVVGNGSCSSNKNRWSNTGNQPFRCCYRLK